ncbi:hypothetical protein AAEP80_08470 [Curtobacterium sp. L3-7]
MLPETSAASTAATTGSNSDSSVAADAVTVLSPTAYSECPITVGTSAR